MSSIKSPQLITHLREKDWVLPPRYEQDKGVCSYHICSKLCWRIYSRQLGKKNILKASGNNEKKYLKLILFADDMIFYTKKNSKKAIKKLLEQTNELSKAAEYKNH